MPPWQFEIGGGVSVSGKSCTTIPHAPLCSTRLDRTVSFRPPAISMPVPTGADPAIPEPGTLGLLLSWTKLFSITVHECVPVGPVPPFGQAPSWGGGASSLFSELGTMPALLSSHSEFLMIRWPPLFVPE